MKKVYLVHGWGGSATSEAWFGWLKEKLKEENIMVDALEMPESDYPRIETWVKYLDNTVKDLGEETYFVGHSIGCQAILRFLEKLPENIKIGGCVFVAGFFNLKEETYECEEDREIAKPWIETPISLEKVKEHTNNFLAIFSNDDPDVPVSDSEIFKEKLNAEIIIKENEEHFNKTMEIPEILEFIK
jgi:hypothetical protein